LKTPLNHNLGLNGLRNSLPSSCLQRQAFAGKELCIVDPETGTAYRDWVSLEWSQRNIIFHCSCWNSQFGDPPTSKKLSVTILILRPHVNHRKLSRQAKRALDSEA